MYRPDIDGLRALAVVSVVIYHITPGHLPGGYLGVDIFFVISGYLITLIILREQAGGTFSFANFYARRVRRLFPALALVMFSTLLFGSFVLFADEWERLGRHAASAVVFLLNFELMGEAGYFDVVSEAKPLLHLWSLSVEEQFYLFWPLILLLLLRIRAPLVVSIIALILGSFTFTLVLATRNPDALYYHPLTRFWELLIGAALAWWHNRRGVDVLPGLFATDGARNLLSAIGLAAIMFSLLYYEGNLPWPSVYALLPLLGVTILIASGQGAIVNRFLSWPMFVWLGLISYPLYLWHWPILSYIRIMESGKPSPHFLWLGAALAVLLAAITYHLVEKPLRHSGRRQIKVLAFAMISLFVLSRLVVEYEGMPNRAAVAYIAEAEAQMQRESRQDEDCLSLFPKEDAPVYCRLAGPMDSMIAIIGDSHAHVLFPGVAAQAEEAGYGTLLLANSGCPPLLGAVTGRNDAEQKACQRSIQIMLESVMSDKRIQSVVISTRGPIYLEGKGFGPAEADYNHPPIASGDGLEESPDEIFRRGLTNTVGQLKSVGKQVAYFLQVPELGVPAKDCLQRPLTILNAEGCDVPYQVYADRMRSYRALVETASGGFTVIDPEKLFCTNGVCRGFEPDIGLLYADDDHLSVIGSHYVAPLVMAGLWPKQLEQTNSVRLVDGLGASLTEVRP